MKKNEVKQHQSPKKKKRVKSKEALTVKRVKKKRKGDLIFFLIMLIGFAIFAYPFISNGYYKWVQKQAIVQYDKTVASKDRAQQEQIKKEMEEYNARLAAEKYQELEMPFLKAEKENAQSGKSRELGEVLAVIEIPKILVELPVYNGTSEAQLHQGAGLLIGTSMPYGGESSHSVITGHRGLPSAKLFTDLPKLEKGDQFYLHLMNDTHAYEVDQIKVVEPTDLSDLRITQGQDYVTLLTCTPYMVNSHRLLVRGHRIPYDASKRQTTLRQAKRNYLIELALYLAGALFVLLIIWWLRRRRKQKQEKQLAEVVSKKRKKTDRKSAGN